MQAISSWELPPSPGAGGYGAPPVFSGVTFVRERSTLKVAGKGLTVENVPAITAAVKAVYGDGAKPNGLSVRGASSSLAFAPSPSPPRCVSEARGGRELLAVSGI